MQQTNQKAQQKNPIHAFQLQLKNKNLRLSWHMILVPILVGDLGGFSKYVHGCFVCAPPYYLPSAQGIQKRTLDSLNWSYRSGCRELNQGSPKGGTASILKC